MKSARYWIETLDLSALPDEGGMYREVYRATEMIPESALPKRFGGARSHSTSIYYLLEHPEFSAFHRLNQDELWHFYDGSALCAHIIDPDGNYSRHRVGCDIASGEVFQLVLPAGHLFAAEVVEVDGYALIGCTVAPGFEFADFEAPDRTALLDAYPQHADMIRKLSRD